MAGPSKDEENACIIYFFYFSIDDIILFYSYILIPFLSFPSFSALFLFLVCLCLLSSLNLAVVVIVNSVLRRSKSEVTARLAF